MAAQGPLLGHSGRIGNAAGDDRRRRGAHYPFQLAALSRWRVPNLHGDQDGLSTDRANPARAQPDRPLVSELRSP
jgi:hypothetical protein